MIIHDFKKKQYEPEKVVENRKWYQPPDLTEDSPQQLWLEDRWRVVEKLLLWVGIIITLVFFFTFFRSALSSVPINRSTAQDSPYPVFQE